MALQKFETTLFDFNLFGDAVNGELVEVREKEAFINSLRLWMTSYEGDFIGGRTIGGYVTSALSRPMSEVDRMDVEGSIREGLTNDFSPSVTVNSIEVFPNYEKRRWEVTLDVYAPSLRSRFVVNDKIKELS